MAATTVYQPTASQQASASVHLEREAEWRYVRVNGVRYVVLPSGRSAHTYTVRADGQGCSCPHYTRTYSSCSHMLAIRAVNERQQRPAQRSYRDLYGVCEARGCDEDRARGEDFCERHILVSAF